MKGSINVYMLKANVKMLTDRWTSSIHNIKVLYLHNFTNLIYTLNKPATVAAPHLSRCIPAITPPALISAPPVSYVIP